MAIDCESDPLVTLDEARLLVPGKPVSRATIWRWVSPGINGVQLAVVRKGGRTFTRKSFLQEFLRRLSETPAYRASPRDPKLPPSPRQLRQRARRAKAELFRRFGISA
jgi:hypothetical protein